LAHRGSLLLLGRGIRGRDDGETDYSKPRAGATGVVGLTCAILSDHWNQGFATEVAQVSLEIGFGRLGLSEIASWTLPINLASQRVIEKLGFQHERDFEFAGLAHNADKKGGMAL
jgi:RimJ/RimL family protein N-acetyltransferase